MATIDEGAVRNTRDIDLLVRREDLPAITAALSAADRSYQEFQTAFEQRLIQQGGGENRGLEETLSRAWQALAALPRRELTMLPAEALDAYYPRAPVADDGPASHGTATTSERPGGEAATSGRAGRE